MAALAPMPMASDSTAVAVKPGLRRSMRSGVADVARGVVEPAPDPGLAHVFLHLREAAELERRPPPRFVFAQAGLHQVLDAPVEVIAQLAVEILFQPAAPPGQQIEELGAWRYFPSSKISRTASVSRSQLSFSTASCFRPARVSA